MNKFIIYLVLINVFALLLFGVDKWLAIHKMNRISEFSLIALILLGAPLGSLIGMFIFHHKTKKIKFYIYVILSFLLWIYVLLKKGVIT